MSFKEIERKIISLADPQIAKQSQKFFKTQKGEYAYGDIFLGIRVPVIRKLEKSYKNISLNNLNKLLESKYHEIRLFALIGLVNTFKKYSIKQQDIHNIYLKNTKYINNWDLVDISAPHIVGNFLLTKDKDILYKLASSEMLWERRIAIVSTFSFIRNNEFSDTIKISKILLKDQQDLIHKAVGWMLREVGNRDLNILINFLNKYYKIMPRTMLRYSIEKLEESKRQLYLKGEI